jgi:hypothetical protein
LQEWATSQGGNFMAALPTPTPGGFFAMILAFLKTIMASMGCPIAAAKSMVDNHPIAAQVVLFRRARKDGNFARNDIPNAVAASYYLLSKSSEAEYAAFAAAA